MCKTVTILLAAALLATGCADSGSTAPTTQKASLQSAAAPTASPQAAPAPGYEREQKELVSDKQPVGPVAEKVDWAEVRGFAQVDAALLPASERAKLDDITVPVLVPDDGRLLATALITHHQNWYAAAMELPGADIYVRGTRNAFEVPAMEIPAAAAAAKDNYLLTRIHQVVTVSWRSFNVSYSLDVECAKPMTDTRCTEDEFALELAERLGVVNPHDPQKSDDEVTR